jgi:demethylmenaquinone methyltransferase/2-methoxy-6-polyprenyl-1,4-benzoquinol methylase
MNQQQNNSHPLDQYYSKIYRNYDLVNRLFTLGNDKKWRNQTAIECLKNNPIDIIDLCCGTGDICIVLSGKANSKIRITGFDLNQQMLEMARTKSKNILNIKFTQGDVADMPFNDESFDAMTIGFGFRNLTFENNKTEIHLKEMNRILRKGARLHILESSVPSNKLIRSFYKFYLSVILIPLGALISGNWKAYSYLARSSANFFNVQEVNEILMKYGFEVLKVKTFFFGASNLITAVKK